MTETEKNALVLSLIEALRARGGRCGEAHVQKSTYFLEGLCGIPLEFGFVLYKHGPFSFDLRDRLTALRADGFLALEVGEEGSGPRIKNTELASLLGSRFKEVLEKYRESVSFVAEKLAQRRGADLERLSTALLVTRQRAGSEVDRAERIAALKPHIARDVALEAVREVDRLQRECHRVRA